MSRFDPCFALLSGVFTLLYLGLTVWAWGGAVSLFWPLRSARASWGVGDFDRRLLVFRHLGLQPRAARLTGGEVDLCPPDDPRFGPGVVTALRRSMATRRATLASSRF
jgi:hypothetical protein